MRSGFCFFLDQSMQLLGSRIQRAEDLYAIEAQKS